MRKPELRKVLYASVAAILLMGLGGCAAKDKGPQVRYMEPGEAGPLMALQQSGKSSMPKGGVKLDPSRLEAHGDAMVRKSDWGAARFQYSRALTLAKGPAIERIRVKLAEVYLKSRQFSLAEDMFAKLTESGKPSAECVQGKGLALLGLGRLDEAEKGLKQAASMKKGLWRSWSGLGIIYNRTKRPALAVSAFRHAVGLRPDLPSLHNNLGMAYMLNNELALAENSLRMAVKMDPSYRMAHNNLGLVMARMGRWQQALSAFELGSGKAQAHNNLGVLRAWEGDYVEAKEQFKRASRVMPRFYPLASRHLEQIQDLGSGGVALRSQDRAGAPLAGDLLMVTPQSRRASVKENKGAAHEAKRASAPPASAEGKMGAAAEQAEKIEGRVDHAMPAARPKNVAKPEAAVEKTTGNKKSVAEPPSPAKALAEPTKAPEADNAKGLAPLAGPAPLKRLPMGFIGVASRGRAPQVVEGLVVAGNGKLLRLSREQKPQPQPAALLPKPEASAMHKKMTVAAEKTVFKARPTRGALRWVGSME